MKNLFIYFLFTLGFLLTNCRSEPFVRLIDNDHFVTKKEAEKIVESKLFYKVSSKTKLFNANFLSRNKRQNGDSLQIDNIVEIKDKKGINAFYAINLKDNGYILFAADKRSHPIMGIVESGKFELSEDLPQSFLGYLDTEIHELELAREDNVPQLGEIKGQWDAIVNREPPDGEGGNAYDCPSQYHSSVGPLLKTKWGQGDGYNWFCPDKGCYGDGTPHNGRAWTGCVATAVAQIMKYNEFPNNYNWSLMPNIGGSQETSQLMADVGGLVNMNYGCASSSAFDEKAAEALSFLGYSAVSYTNFNHTYIPSLINSNYPVYLSGGRYYGFLGLQYKGHAWVCDGYVQGYSCIFDDNGMATGGYGYFMLFMNWGWGGLHDGLFGVNNFSPGENTYNQDRKMIYYAKP